MVYLCHFVKAFKKWKRSSSIVAWKKQQTCVLAQNTVSGATKKRRLEKQEGRELVSTRILHRCLNGLAKAQASSSIEARSKEVYRRFIGWGDLHKKTMEIAQNDAWHTHAHVAILWARMLLHNLKMLQWRVQNSSRPFRNRIDGSHDATEHP